MRKTLIAIVLLAPLALVSTPAAADGYLGLGVGAADNSGDNLDTSAAGRIFGGVSFLEDWGVELGYIDFGEFDSDTGGSVEVAGGYVALAGFSQFGPSIELTGKLGAFIYDQDFNSARGFTGSADGESVFLGIGVNRYITPSVAIGIEVNHLNDVEDESITAVFLQLHVSLGL